MFAKLDLPFKSKTIGSMWMPSPVPTLPNVHKQKVGKLVTNSASGKMLLALKVDSGLQDVL